MNFIVCENILMCKNVMQCLHTYFKLFDVMNFDFFQTEFPFKKSASDVSILIPSRPQFVCFKYQQTSRILYVKFWNNFHFKWFQFEWIPCLCENTYEGPFCSEFSMILLTQKNESICNPLFVKMKTYLATIKEFYIDDLMHLIWWFQF